MLKQRILGFLLILVAFSCGNKRELEISIFHWKTKFNPSAIEQQFIKTNRIQKVYLRYFDVKVENSIPIPVSTLSYFERIDSLEYIPCVYIQNKALQGLLSSEIQVLAKHIGNKINSLNAKHSIQSNEVLLDCDWTNSTRQGFFELINTVEQNLSIQVSSTVRLHQFKNFEKTGVPPVEKGILMMYNMGELTDINAQNSIVNSEIAHPYKRPFSEYPIQLDIALPIFSWLVLYRDSKSIELISEFDSQLLSKQNLFTEIEPNLFRLELDTFIFGNKRYKYDYFKLEESKNEAVFKMMNDWKEVLPKDSLELIFYDLRIQNLNNRNELIQKLENSF